MNCQEKKRQNLEHSRDAFRERFWKITSDSFNLCAWADKTQTDLFSYEFAVFSSWENEISSNLVDVMRGRAASNCCLGGFFFLITAWRLPPRLRRRANCERWTKSALSRACHSVPFAFAQGWTNQPKKKKGCWVTMHFTLNTAGFCFLPRIHYYYLIVRRV